MYSAINRAIHTKCERWLLSGKTDNAAGDKRMDCTRDKPAQFSQTGKRRKMTIGHAIACSFCMIQSPSIPSDMHVTLSGTCSNRPPIDPFTIPHSVSHAFTEGFVSSSLRLSGMDSKYARFKPALRISWNVQIRRHIHWMESGFSRTSSDIHKECRKCSHTGNHRDW